jgi:hypothetical protein
VQHCPEMQGLVPGQAQSTLPHVLVSVVPHAVPQAGRLQHAPFTHVPPALQVKVAEPHAFVTVPQKFGSGRVGNGQHVPAPPEPVVVHPKPLPHEVSEQVFEPQALVTIVLQAAPLPPHVGSTQHAPGVFGSGWLHCEPEAHPHVRTPPHPSSSWPQAVPQGVRAQQVPVTPALVDEHTPSETQGQLIVPPQPSGRVPPHFPAKAAAQVFRVQHD